MDLPVVTPRRLLADKGYDSDRIRENLLFRGILPVIPPRSNRTEDIPCDFRRYRDRNRIERMFNKLKQFRRIATRYDKTRKSFLAFLNLAAVKLWLPSFVNRTYGVGLLRAAVQNLTVIFRLYLRADRCVWRPYALLFWQSCYLR